MKLRNIITGSSLIITSCLLSTSALAHYSGHVGNSGNPATNNGKNCNYCHNATVGNQPRIAPEAVLTGPKIVLTGATNRYKLTMTGGQKKGGGFNASVQKGQFIIPPEFDFKIREEAFDPNFPKELTQISGRFVQNDALGTLVWEFDWKAPDVTENVSMYAAALSTSNGNGKDGDRATSVSLDINVVTALPDPVAPIAAIDTVKSADISSVVSFSGTRSSDEDGSIVSYSWDFGDGHKADAVSATHTFTTVAMHTVKLTVTDNTSGAGLTNTTFVDISIVDISNGGALVPVAIMTLPSTAETGMALQFDAAQSVANNSTAAYLWDFGDDSQEHSFAPTTNVTHSYATAGTYTVTLAVQEGSFTGITSTELTVSDRTGNGGGNTARTGEIVYKAECESCHGVAGVGKTGANGAKKIIGATSLLIKDAIATTVSSMSGITLQAGDTALLAKFLATGAGTTGDTIYRTKCEICHGAAGVGASAKNIENATQQMILDAIAQTTTTVIPLMKGIVISASEATLLETLLTTATGPVETGQTLYDKHCKICHGVSGTGGSAKLIVNATLNRVDTAITNIPKMNSVPAIMALTAAQRQMIVDYLKSGTALPGDPVKGELTYKAKCQMCHGTGAGGMAIGILNVSVTMIENAIINIPYMKTITLTQIEKENLVARLAQGETTKPTTGLGLFTMYCSYCHGADGLGGAFKNAPIKGMGITAQMIIDAYTGAEPEMTASNLRNAGLTLADRQAIANWLK